MLKKNKEVTVYNKILPTFKSVHVDGAYGGITTRGFINVSFFAERSPIPTSSTFVVTQDDKIGDFIKNSEESKVGLIREFEAGIFMDIEVAKALVSLLSQKVSELEKALKK